MEGKNYHYLALGDSYTLGEAVNVEESFPHQLCQYWKNTFGVQAGLEVIAKTGWRCDQLLNELRLRQNNGMLQANYDLATVLIGVNNQYQKRPLDEFGKQLDELCEFVSHLVPVCKIGLVSIPDYGFTPFGFQDKGRIYEEIEMFNNMIQKKAESWGAKYYYITDITRQAEKDLSLIATDQLHPSSLCYREISRRLASGLYHQLIS